MARSPLFLRRIMMALPLWLLAGCTGNDSALADLRHFTYFPAVGKLKLFSGFVEEKVLQLSYSPDGKWIAYTKVMPDGNIDLFKVSEQWEMPVQVTSGEPIEFDPAIDDDGDVAFATHVYDVALSDVYLSGHKLDLPPGLYGKLALRAGTLSGQYQMRSDGSNWLLVLDTVTGQYSFHPINILVDGLYFDGSGGILLEGVTGGTGVAVAELFSLQDGTFRNLSQVPSLLDVDNVLAVTAIPGVPGASALGFLAEAALRRNDPAGSLSSANNFLGRLSWGAAYRLNGLLDLAGTATGNRLGVKQLIRNMARNLISGARFDDRHPGWPTKKYSLSRNTPLSLLVDDAAILYPLLRAHNLGLIDTVTGNSVVALAHRVFDYHEADFDQVHALYRFRKGIDFKYDGVWLPFNQQNTFGSVLIELYRATGNPVFRERAFSLARAFRQEFVYPPDGRLLWHYWPALFYSGWTSLDDVSVHTPFNAPSVDDSFEDLAHASFNLRFILDFACAFPGEVFTASDLQRLKTTLQKVQYGTAYSSTMSGVTTQRAASAQFMPQHSWLWLENQQLLEQHGDGIASFRPYFDGDTFSCYAEALAVTETLLHRALTNSRSGS